MRRFFDIIFATIAIVLLSPLLIPIAVLLRFTGEGEIFYKQERIGKNAKPFYVFKFATMLKDSPNLGTGTVTVKGDPRILPMGIFLRKTKINELPQILNILFGDMSFIGPRPLTQRGFGAYSLEYQGVISKMRPGLSGIGSILLRNEEGLMSLSEDPMKYYDDVILPYKGALENWYSSRQGLLTYFLLIFLTVWVVLFSRSNLVWKLLPGLPNPPQELGAKLVK